MARREKPPWKFVELEWVDSTGPAGGWVSEGSLPAASDMISRGWLIAETEREIVLAGTYYRVDGQMNFGEVIAIPRCAFLAPPKELRLR